ncbi:hypothetical protein [Ohtaekwangia koreensis]|uniref:Uncharacterized protein n=1 Tax=Ohtaekwangia koreensis TaxID=688867 RepID=A0A1T5LCB7_9BACT|nr:hypothetical protein [Ohtaekwangia koreensis]SKC73642.1 hypothetical protein SAMN05660236_2959 [Ohtaekwangia koreensis]
MRASASYYKATAFLLAFFVLVFAIAFSFNRYYPVLVIAGESSVGTWMSGVLLTISATISLILGMRHGWRPWFVFAAFFFVLALDERFMFHEHLKEWIIFSSHTNQTSRWVYELPAIAGGLVGAYIAIILWKNLEGVSRIFLLSATILGTASVTIDVFAAGVLWEECFKLLGELSITCALLRKADL